MLEVVQGVGTLLVVPMSSQAGKPSMSQGLGSRSPPEQRPKVGQVD